MPSQITICLLFDVLGEIENRREYEKKIWSFDGDDDINKRINSEVLEIERLCIPALSGEKK